jgi:glycosyltransferase involved in cell wall biosynthesis
MKAKTHSPSGDVKKPILSIGMPIYNGARFVQEAIDSILEQDCDLELIISDNGSTDGTEKICRQYASKDGRIRYHRYDENRGAAWNYNNCFILSQSRYFKWAAYDDKLAPDFGAKCLSVLEDNPDVVLAYPRATVIDEVGKFVRYDSDRLDLTDERPHVRFRMYFEAYTGHNICNPVFGVFRSDVLARTKLIGNFLTSDRILLGEIALHGKIHEVPEDLFYFRWHPHNSMCGYSAAERILWFDPSNKGKLFLSNWVFFHNWSDSIAKAPMSSGEKFLCTVQLYRWGLQNIGTLSKELLKGILWPVLRRTPFYRGRDTGY